MRGALGRLPLVLFLRTRRVGWAVGLGAVLAVGLLTSERQVAVPLFGTATTTVFVWPLLATVPTALLLSPSTGEWDARSVRPIRLLHATVVVALGAASTSALVVLAPPGWTSALAMYLALQAVTVAATRVLGDWAWMPTVAVGSLTVVNSPFVTATMVGFTSRHWGIISATATLTALVALLAPRTNVRSSGRFGPLRRGRRAE